jgi:hypothetical protein
MLEPQHAPLTQAPIFVDLIIYGSLKVKALENAEFDKIAT